MQHRMLAVVKYFASTLVLIVTFFFWLFCISSDWIGLYCQIEPWAAAGYQLCRQSLGQECRHYALYIPWLQPFHCNTMHYTLYIPWLQLFHRHTMHYVLYIRSVQLFHSNTINALWIIHSLTQPFWGNHYASNIWWHKAFHLMHFTSIWFIPYSSQPVLGHFGFYWRRKCHF